MHGAVGRREAAVGQTGDNRGGSPARPGAGFTNARDGGAVGNRGVTKRLVNVRERAGGGTRLGGNGTFPGPVHGRYHVVIGRAVGGVGIGVGDRGSGRGANGAVARAAGGRALHVVAGRSAGRRSGPVQGDLVDARSRRQAGGGGRHSEGGQGGNIRRVGAFAAHVHRRHLIIVGRATGHGIGVGHGGGGGGANGDISPATGGRAFHVVTDRAAGAGGPAQGHGVDSRRGSQTRRRRGRGNAGGRRHVSPSGANTNLIGYHRRAQCKEVAYSICGGISPGKRPAGCRLRTAGRRIDIDAATLIIGSAGIFDEFHHDEIGGVKADGAASRSQNCPTTVVNRRHPKSPRSGHAHIITGIVAMSGIHGQTSFVGGVRGGIV